MGRWRGRALVGIAGLHTAFTATIAAGVGYTPELMEVAGGSAPLTRMLPGMGSVQPPDMPALAMFWSMAFGVATGLLGLLIDQLEREGVTVSGVVAGGLLLLGAVGAVLVPVGGFWLVLPVAGSLLWSATRAR
ncbi:MAG: hypothetical protein H6738_04355 [Alphaproteobacteria bacterium]|nr:hypothetical protein [Alphaproteobacteria bacterium]MCB9696004.1 hypothetical protein [Alphaproteobacteria bacterium]